MESKSISQHKITMTQKECSAKELRDMENARLAPTLADLMAMQDRYEAIAGCAGTGYDAIELMRYIDEGYYFSEYGAGI